MKKEKKSVFFLTFNLNRILIHKKYFFNNYFINQYTALNKSLDDFDCGDCFFIGSINSA